MHNLQGSLLLVADMLTVPVQLVGHRAWRCHVQPAIRSVSRLKDYTKTL